MLSRAILTGYTSDDSKVSRIGGGDSTRRQNGGRRVDVQDDRLVGARNLHARRDHIRRDILFGVWILSEKYDFSRTQPFVAITQHVLVESAPVVYFSNLELNKIATTIATLITGRWSYHSAPIYCSTHHASSMDIFVVQNNYTFVRMS